MEIKCIYACNDMLHDKYTCKVLNTIKFKPGTRIASYRGIHAAGKTNIDVEGLLIRHSPIIHFPRGLSKFFPKLTHVKIENCGLTEISRTDFEGLGNLKYLSLSYNKLRSLPNDLFVETPKLLWIYFDRNQIESLSSKIFDPLDIRKIKDFFLSENANIDRRYVRRRGGYNIAEFMKEIDANCLPSIKNIPLTPRQPPTKLENRFHKYKEYFATGKFSDFTIKNRDKKYKVHKIVLAAQSSVFQTMFSKDSLKAFKMNTIVAHGAFEDFLQYFYFASIRSEDNVMELFGLAVKFDVTTLKVECEEIILRDLKESNSLEVYNLAHLYGSKVLKKAAFATIKNSFPKISDNLIDDPKSVAELVTAKRHLDKLTNAANGNAPKKNDSNQARGQRPVNRRRYGAVSRFFLNLKKTFFSCFGFSE